MATTPTTTTKAVYGAIHKTPSCDRQVAFQEKMS
jgi:hypothetical protein